MYYMNCSSGEVTTCKREAEKWNKSGCNMYVYNEYGYKYDAVGVWFFEKSKPEFFNGFVNTIWKFEKQLNN